MIRYVNEKLIENLYLFRIKKNIASELQRIKEMYSLLGDQTKDWVLKKAIEISIKGLSGELGYFTAHRELQNLRLRAFRAWSSE